MTLLVFAFCRVELWCGRIFLLFFFPRWGKGGGGGAVRHTTVPTNRQKTKRTLYVRLSPGRRPF